MPSELIISVSGLRGVVGETLTSDVAQRYARAFVAGLPSGPIVMGNDGRATGPTFAQAIGEALSVTILSSPVTAFTISRTSRVGRCAELAWSSARLKAWS